MSLQLEVDSTLSDEDTVYRIVDFFSAAQIVLNHKFMFSRADTFLDKNEGIDRLLAQLEASGAGSCFGMGWSDKETAKKSHRLTQESHYISCWSRACDSVAMWSLYSQDLASIRISTKIAKLKVLAENLINKYSFLRFGEEDLNRSAVICAEAHITPVGYKSLNVLSSKVQRRLKAFRRVKERYLREGKELPKPGDIPSRYFETALKLLVPISL